MRKVLALMLSCVLLFGMVAPAWAATGVKTRTEASINSDWYRSSSLVNFDIDPNWVGECRDSIVEDAGKNVANRQKAFFKAAARFIDYDNAIMDQIVIYDSERIQLKYVPPEYWGNYVTVRAFEEINEDALLYVNYGESKPKGTPLDFVVWLAAYERVEGRPCYIEVGQLKNGEYVLRLALVDEKTKKTKYADPAAYVKKNSSDVDKYFAMSEASYDASGYVRKYILDEDYYYDNYSSSWQSWNREYYSSWEYTKTTSTTTVTTTESSSSYCPYCGRTCGCGTTLIPQPQVPTGVYVDIPKEDRGELILNLNNGISRKVAEYKVGGEQYVTAIDVCLLAASYGKSLNVEWRNDIGMIEFRSEPYRYRDRVEERNWLYGSGSIVDKGSQVYSIGYVPFGNKTPPAALLVGDVSIVHLDTVLRNLGLL